MKKLFSFFFLMTLTFSFAQQAEELVNKYVEALGGKNKLQSVHAILQKGTIEQSGTTLPFETYQSTNGNGYMKMELAGMPLIVYAVKDGKGFTMNQMMAYDDLDEETAKKLQEKNKKIFGEVVYEMPDKDKMKYVGTEEVDGKKYEVIELQAEGQVLKIYFDPDTGLIRMTAVDTPDGTVVSEIAEYTEVNGIKFPKKMLTKFEGTTVSTMDISEIIVNPSPDQIDQNAFVKPE